jgi:hypothetical protein
LESSRQNYRQHGKAQVNRRPVWRGGFLAGREHARRYGGREPEKAGSAHAEFVPHHQLTRIRFQSRVLEGIEGSKTQPMR